MNSHELFTNTPPRKLFFFAALPGAVSMLASALYQLFTGRGEHVRPALYQLPAAPFRDHDVFTRSADGKPIRKRKFCQDWLIPKTTINTVKEQVAAGLYRAFEGREKIICLTMRASSYAEKGDRRCRRNRPLRHGGLARIEALWREYEAS